MLTRRLLLAVPLLNMLGQCRLPWRVCGSDSIGGIRVGTSGKVGSSYQGYRLVGGSDFDSSLADELVRPGNPYGKITHNFSERDRRHTSATSVFALSDRYWTGDRDANDGVSISSFSDVLSMSNGVIALKTRRATLNEKMLMRARDNSAAQITYVELSDVNAMSSRRPLVNAAVSMLPSFAYTGNRIVEVKWRYVVGAQAGGMGNPSNAIWELNVRGGSEEGGNAGSEWNDEADWTELFYGPAQATLRTGPGQISSGTFGVRNDGRFQLTRATCSETEFKLETYSADEKTQLGSVTLANSRANHSQLFYLLFGNVVVTKGFNENAWVGKVATMEVDFIRIWIPLDSRSLSPRVADSAPTTIPFRGQGYYRLSSQVAMWGEEVDAEVIQFMSAYDTNGPGRPIDEIAPMQTRDMLPVGVSYEPSSRVLLFDSQFSAQPGVIHGYVFPRSTGVNFVLPHKFAVYVLPKISIPPLPPAVAGRPYLHRIPRGVPRNWDNGNCPHGVHSGLVLHSGPKWLSFDSTTTLFAAIVRWGTSRAK